MGNVELKYFIQDKVLTEVGNLSGRIAIFSWNYYKAENRKKRFYIAAGISDLHNVENRCIYISLNSFELNSKYKDRLHDIFFSVTKKGEVFTVLLNLVETIVWLDLILNCTNFAESLHSVIISYLYICIICCVMFGKMPSHAWEIVLL